MAKLRDLTGLAALLIVIVVGTAIQPGSATFAQGGRNDQADCGDPVIATLWAGQDIEAGYVAVWHDETQLYIQFFTTGGWTLTETHVHVAPSLEGIPANDQGIPVPGQFDYRSTHANATSYTVTIPLAWDESAGLVIAAHAAVALLDSHGDVVQTETAWGGDTPGGGARWWYYLAYTVQPCADGGDDDHSAGEGCTPGYWRNHTDDWDQTGYAPDQTVGSVFADATGELAGDTLLDAVKYATKGQGRDNTVGAARTLLRAGVAALLNAARADVDFPYAATDVITTVNGALKSDSRSVMLAVAGTLDETNNLGCPLNGTNSTGNGSKNGDKDTGKPDNPGNGNNNDDDLEQSQPLNPGHGNQNGGKNPGKPDNPGNGKGKKID